MTLWLRRGFAHGSATHRAGTGRARRRRPTRTADSGFQARTTDPPGARRAPGTSARHLWRARGLPFQRRTRLERGPYSSPTAPVSAWPDDPVQGHLPPVDQDATTMRSCPASRSPWCSGTPTARRSPGRSTGATTTARFSGSFTAPRDRLTGQAMIEAVDGPRGSTGIPR